MVNTSPLIVLARAGLIELLRVAGEQIIVPAAVVTEVSRRGSSDIAVRALNGLDWLIVAHDVAVPRRVRELGLGSGESAVIAWALAIRWQRRSLTTRQYGAKRAASAYPCAER